MKLFLLFSAAILFVKGGKQKGGAVKKKIAALEKDIAALEKEQVALGDKVEECCAAKPGGIWQLGMNLNPADSHVMGYGTGWATGNGIGSEANAFMGDYLNKQVWKEPANYIAIARHHDGVVDAVKVFKFKHWGMSLLSRFQDMNPGRRVETVGGAIQESVASTAQNLDDDPIFGAEGDLAFNWGYTDNGHRIVLTGGHLSEINVNDDNTHGLGNDFACNPLEGISAANGMWAHEISNIQNCPLATCRTVQVQGSDHGTGPHLITSPVYGNYAIYVSMTADSFPKAGSKLELQMEMGSRAKPAS